jgi:DNA-binding transcriptional ArsR family regulator
VSVSALTEFAALVAGPARARMLLALLEEGPLTARELADAAGVTPQTASGHLEKLICAGLLTVEPLGRHRHHRLAPGNITNLIRAVYAGGAELTRRHGIRGRHEADIALKTARTCGGHIAGRLGVALAGILTDGWNPSAGVKRGTGRHVLLRWGLEELFVDRLPMHCETCLDWSEGTPHLGGSVGKALLDHSLSLGWVRRRTQDRVLTVTPAGARGYQNRFGIVLPAS